jgi:hypothetical protein
MARYSTPGRRIHRLIRMAVFMQFNRTIQNFTLVRPFIPVDIRRHISWSHPTLSPTLSILVSTISPLSLFCPPPARPSQSRSLTASCRRNIAGGRRVDGDDRAAHGPKRTKALSRASTPRARPPPAVSPDLLGREKRDRPRDQMDQTMYSLLMNPPKGCQGVSTSISKACYCWSSPDSRPSLSQPGESAKTMVWSVEHDLPGPARFSLGAPIKHAIISPELRMLIRWAYCARGRHVLTRSCSH